MVPEGLKLLLVYTDCIFKCYLYIYNVGRLIYDVHFRKDIKMRIYFTRFSDQIMPWLQELYVLYILFTPSLTNTYITSFYNNIKLKVKVVTFRRT